MLGYFDSQSNIASIESNYYFNNIILCKTVVEEELLTKFLSPCVWFSFYLCLVMLEFLKKWETPTWI